MVAFFLVLACVLRFAGKDFSLLGEVNRATPVDNQRRRGAAIAGFRIVLFGSRIDLCLVSTKSRVTRTFRKIGNPCSYYDAIEERRNEIRFRVLESVDGFDPTEMTVNRQ